MEAHDNLPGLLSVESWRVRWGSAGVRIDWTRVLGLVVLDDPFFCLSPGWSLSVAGAGFSSSLTGCLAYSSSLDYIAL